MPLSLVECPTWSTIFNLECSIASRDATGGQTTSYLPLTTHVGMDESFTAPFSKSSSLAKRKHGQNNGFQYVQSLGLPLGLRTHLPTLVLEEVEILRIPKCPILERTAAESPLDL